MILLDEPWRTVGFDLDGTLAIHYWPGEGPYDCYKIGDPIPPMVEVCKQHIAKGDNVVIFTARVAPNGSYLNAEGEDVERIRQAIRDWTKEHIGTPLEATAIKDYKMSVFYDDRAIQVVSDKGLLLQDFVGPQTMKVLYKL